MTVVELLYCLELSEHRGVATSPNYSIARYKSTTVTLILL